MSAPLDALTLLAVLAKLVMDILRVDPLRFGPLEPSFDAFGSSQFWQRLTGYLLYVFTKSSFIATKLGLNAAAQARFEEARHE